MKAFGIDPGTSSSPLSYFHDGKAETLLLDNEQERIPSVVFIDEDSRLLGFQAHEYRYTQPERVLFGTKSYLGKRLKKQIGGENFYSSDLSYDLLDFMRRKAKEHFGEDILNAVIALPSYFDETQRKSVLTAAKKAEINVLGLVSEAHAVAIDYSYNKRLRQNLVIVDIGSGAFEVAIVEVKHNEITLLASGGSDLGGNDIDSALAGFFKKKMAGRKKIDSLPEGEVFYQNLLKIAEKIVTI